MSDVNDSVSLSEAAQVAAEVKTSELDILRQSLEEAKLKAADHYDQLLRLKAEFDNYRKRMEREKENSRRWGKEEIILRLVSLMDVMEQAESAAHTSPDVKSMVLGLDMLYGEFKRLLKEEGLEEIVAVAGDPYDHNLQEAVETVESDQEEGKILAVLQKGYRFQGMLFRPARVKISKHKGAGDVRPLEKSQDDAPAI
ncbi:MAG: nucleotide exchange factor GrpE [Elusimicrobia bacterium]|nr:nucleotide exchange factor GrpE [Elusimicrobiota bacterium]